MRRHHAGRLDGAIRILTLTGLMLMIGVAFALPLVPARAASNHVITMTDYAFNPQFLTIPAGDSVQWTNDGSASHTATANSSDPMVWTDIVLSPTQTSGMVTLNIPGVYDYICSFHFSLGMWGRITVTGTAVPEFSGELFVVIGLVAVMFGVMSVRRRQN